MKTIFNFSKTIVSLFLILSLSCSSDNEAGSSNMPTEQEDSEEMHTYNLSFAGGELDGKTFSNSYLNNKVIPRISETEDEDGNLIEDMAIIFIDKESGKDIKLTFRLRKNGARFMNIAGENDGASRVYIRVDGKELTTVSGTIAVTDYGVIDTGSPEIGRAHV